MTISSIGTADLADCGEELVQGLRISGGHSGGAAPSPSRQSRQASVLKRILSVTALAFVAAAAAGATAQTFTLRAQAAPAPEVEYLYNVTVRRQYHFPNNDPISYGHQICDQIARGDSYAIVMGHVKGDVAPNDEFAANYLVSYAVNLLCPAEIWQLRNSAAHYQPASQ
ncbi:DUF732 domain-containing protein [Mycobacterium intracellulare]|uniref:DUF732 domain-containing protein n=1 Tax=Mycobacterium intracellulare TaxID=1767 RepID=UPI003358F5C0